MNFFAQGGILWEPTQSALHRRGGREALQALFAGAVKNSPEEGPGMGDGGEGPFLVSSTHHEGPCLLNRLPRGQLVHLCFFFRKKFTQWSSVEPKTLSKQTRRMARGEVRGLKNKGLGHKKNHQKKELKKRT